MTEIRRGDVVLVDFGTLGKEDHQQQGTRPCVVVQNDQGNAAAPITIVVPCKSRKPHQKMFWFFVEVPGGEGGLTLDSLIDCAHVTAVSKKRIRRKLGVLNPETLQKIDSALRLVLSL